MSATKDRDAGTVGQRVGETKKSVNDGAALPLKWSIEKLKEKVKEKAAKTK